MRLLIVLVKSFGMMKRPLESDSVRVQMYIVKSLGGSFIKIISETKGEFNNLLAIAYYSAIKRVYLARIRDETSNLEVRKFLLNAGEYVVDAAIVEAFEEIESFILKQCSILGLILI